MGIAVTSCLSESLRVTLDRDDVAVLAAVALHLARLVFGVVCI